METLSKKYLELESLQRALELFGKSNEVPVSPSNLFGKMFSNSVKNYLNKEWVSVSYLWDKYGDALVLAREGKLQSAEECFYEANKYRKQLSVSDTFFYFADVFALTTLAYLRFKQQRFIEAESMLLEVMKIDAILISKGFHILEYHRVQQLHNLARLYFKQNRYLDGSKMISDGLGFMIHGQMPTIVTDSEWVFENLSNIPEIIRAEMIYQLVNETIGVYLMNSNIHKNLYYETFYGLQNWNFKSECEEWHIKWFNIKRALLKFNRNFNYNESLNFLLNSPMQYDLYKLSIVYDLTELILNKGILNKNIENVFKQYVGKLSINERFKKIYFLMFEEHKSYV